MEVYGITSSTKGPLFCVSPDKYNGLLVLNSQEVTILDNKARKDLVYYKFESGAFGVFCRVLIEERILDDLYELEPSAYEKFVRYLGKDP